MRKVEEKLIIVGAGEFAEIAYHYFTRWSHYKVVAFSAERNFIDKERLFNLPVVPFEELANLYRSEDHKIFVAVTFTQLNRVRSRLYRKAKENGFSFATFVHPTVFLDETAKIGDNCFIFELNSIQYNVRIGNNVILWSGSVIGHRTVIGDNCFVSAGVTIAGFCDIGENCFIGVKSCIADYKKIAKDCIIGAGAVVIRDTEEGRVYAGNPAKALEQNSFETFKVKSI